MAVNYKKIGKRVQEARILRNLSIADLADKVHFTAKSIVYVENGTAALSLELLLPICTELNITPNDLLEGEYHASSSRSLEEESALKELKDLVAELRGGEDDWGEDIVIRDTATVVREIREMIRQEKELAKKEPQVTKKSSTHW